MIYFFDLAGVAVFAVSGAILAGNKNIDTFGVFVFAFVTAIGGGTLRDLLLGDTPIFWITDSNYLIVSFFSALVTILLIKSYRKRFWPLLIADALGLSVFCILGTQKALSFDVSWMIAIVLGMLSGTFGGVIRDILANETPMLLKKDFYAIPALLGSLIYVIAINIFGSETLGMFIGTSLIFCLRIAALKWHWHLPVFSIVEK